MSKQTVAKKWQNHPVNERLPFGRLFIYGLQHVLAMYAGAVVVPLIIGNALHLANEQIIFLINADLFTCGIATLIQTLGIGRIGIRLPVIQGVTFAAVTPIIQIGLGVLKEENSTATHALVVIFTSVFVGGLFTFLIAPLFSKFIHLFPPVVTGSVILIIGLSLIPTSINMIGGQNFVYMGEIVQPGSEHFGTPSFLVIAAVVILVILALNRFFKGFWKNISVLVGLAAGYVISICAGFVSFSDVTKAPWIRLDLPFGINMPGVGISAYMDAFSGEVLSHHIFMAAISMIVVMIIVMVESTGDFIAIGEIVDMKIEEEEVKAGLRSDGLSTMIGGILNALPYTAFAQNVGLVVLTGVRSRFVVATSGLILVILGLVPKFAAVIDSFPPFVIGGAGFVMFATVAANGIKTLSKANLDTRPNNIFIVAVSIAIGLIPTVASALFAHLPDSLTPLLESGISLTAVTAILLNLAFNGVQGSKSE